MKKIKILFLIFVILSFTFSLGASEKVNKVDQLGGRVIKLVPPKKNAKELVRVEDQNPIVMEYIKAREKKHKLRILAIYADPNEWKIFVDNLSNKRPAKLDNFAFVCAAIKLDTKLFSDSAHYNEKRKYGSWYSLAMNNPPLTKLMMRKANKKLQKETDPGVAINFKTDKYSVKFNETEGSVSFGTKVDFQLFGAHSDSFITISSMLMNQRIMFIAYVDNSGEEAVLNNIKSSLINWRNEIWIANGIPIYPEVDFMNTKPKTTTIKLKD